MCEFSLVNKMVFDKLRVGQQNCLKAAGMLVAKDGRGTMLVLRKTRDSLFIVRMVGVLAEITGLATRLPDSLSNHP